MKTFLILIGTVAAGILGYSFEPQMRYQLTGMLPVDEKPELRHVTVEVPAAPRPAPSPAPVPADPMAPAAPDDTLAAVDPQPAEAIPAPAPAEPEMAEAAPEPAPAPEPEPEPEGPVDVLAVMQSSIRNAEIKEFTFDQVLDWQPSEEPETIDGKTYQTGIASYKAETVFGVKTIQAKALIKGGKVVRWLWPKSGMEIK